MAKTIKFGVHRNPKKDAEGRDTYHVRHASHSIKSTSSVR